MFIFADLFTYNTRDLLYCMTEIFERTPMEVFSYMGFWLGAFAHAYFYGPLAGMWRTGKAI